MPCSCRDLVRLQTVTEVPEKPGRVGFVPDDENDAANMCNDAGCIPLPTGGWTQDALRCPGSRLALRLGSSFSETARQQWDPMPRVRATLWADIVALDMSTHL